MLDGVPLDANFDVEMVVEGGYSPSDIGLGTVPIKRSRGGGNIFQNLWR